MSKKKYVIEGLADACPLCIEGGEGRGKEKRPPVFLVTCEGGFSGQVCAPHLAALIKAAETGGMNTPVRPEPRAEQREAKPEPRPAQAVSAGNGPTK